MYDNKSYRSMDRIIWILTVALFASFIIFDENSWVSIILLGITVLVFIFDSIEGKGKVSIAVGSFHYSVILFCLFCFVSAIWAWDPHLAVEKGITIFEIFICTAILYNHYSKYETVEPLIKTIMWSGYIVVVYSIFFYGIDTIRYRLAAGMQLENSFTNINIIGMTAAISIVLTVYQIVFVDNRLSISNIFVLPSIIVIAATGSRKGLVLLVIGVLLVLLIRFQSKNLLKTVFKWFFFGIVVIALFRVLISLPLFEGINARMEGLFALITGVGTIDHSAYLRQQYLTIGLEQISRAPFFGIGMNNARLLLESRLGINTYLHNNYVELLVDGGLLGFAVYYSIYAKLIISYVKNRLNRDKYFIVCGVMIVLLLISDYGSVSYYSKSTYFYFMVLFLESEILLRKG